MNTSNLSKAGTRSDKKSHMILCFIQTA